MAVHKNLPVDELHEAPQIAGAVIADAGKVITPSSAEDGVGVLRQLDITELTDTSNVMAKVYGGKTVTANATVIATTAAVSSPDFTDPLDYELIPAAVFDSPEIAPAKGLTIGTDSITILQDGVYAIDFWATILSSVNSTLAAFNFGVNGTVNTDRPIIVRVPNNTEPVSGAAHALFEFTAGDVITMHIAASTTANITIKNARLSLQLVDKDVA